MVTLTVTSTTGESMADVHISSVHDSMGTVYTIGIMQRGMRGYTPEETRALAAVLLHQAKEVERLTRAEQRRKRGSR